MYEHFAEVCQRVSQDRKLAVTFTTHAHRIDRRAAACHQNHKSRRTGVGPRHHRKSVHAQRFLLLQPRDYRCGVGLGGWEMANDPVTGFPRGFAQGGQQSGKQRHKRQPEKASTLDLKSLCHQG